MRALRMPLVAAAATLLLALSSEVHGQSMARLTLDPWQGRDLAETYDHPVIQTGGHVDNAPSDSQMFMWDSYGRVRFDRTDQDSPFVAYRIYTANAGTDSRYIKATMDEFDMALGMHLGELAGWRIGAVLGAGYSSTHPFVHTSGIFGIGHVVGERKLDDENSIALSIDYEGNSAFLPDVPLPGFAYVHRDKTWDVMVGYPMNKVVWRPLEPLEITFQYTVPYTANLDVEYRVAQHVGVYGYAGNFFQGFVTAPDGDITNRQFNQQRSVEAGVRLIFAPLVDASIGVGYAFDQEFSRGFDIRDMEPIGHISNEPYIAFVLRGSF